MSTFKGFAVGNPLTWMPFRDFGQYAQYANRQLVPRPMWDSVSAAAPLAAQSNRSSERASARGDEVFALAHALVLLRPRGLPRTHAPAVPRDGVAF